MRDLPQPPRVRPVWGRASAPLGPPEVVRVVLRRRATVALAVHLVIAVGLFGIPSIAGAVTAGLARRAAAGDPDRAAVLIRWSWAFLAVDLLFYALLLVLGLVLAIYLFLVAKAGT